MQLSAHSKAAYGDHAALFKMSPQQCETNVLEQQPIESHVGVQDDPWRAIAST